MRSLLIVPIDPPHALHEASGCGADALVLDMAVGPLTSVAVLDTLPGHLRDIRARNPRLGLYARVHALATGLLDEDLAAGVGEWFDGVMLPKTIGGTDVQRLGVKLGVLEAQRNITDGRLRILAMAGDSAGGILAIATLPVSSPRLSGIAWSAPDLARDLGAETTYAAEGGHTPSLRHARVMTRLAAAAAKVQAIDTGYGDIADLEGLARECRLARRDGFAGKLALHPSQVPVINTIFGA